MAGARFRATEVTDEHLVLDASALVDVLLGEALGAAVLARIDGIALHAPAYLDAEVLSGLGRLHRSGHLSESTVAEQLGVMAAAPIVRHDVADLLRGAWDRRQQLRLADALYVELAARLGLRLLTTDRALGRATDIAEVVTG